MPIWYIPKNRISADPIYDDSKAVKRDPSENGYASGGGISSRPSALPRGYFVEFQITRGLEPYQDEIIKRLGPSYTQTAFQTDGPSAAACRAYSLVFRGYRDPPPAVISVTNARTGLMRYYSVQYVTRNHLVNGQPIGREVRAIWVRFEE